MTLRLHRAAWILPVVSPPVRDGALVLDERGRMVALGPSGEVRGRYSHLHPVEHGNGVLFPGLVNAHTHLEFSHLLGVVPRAREGQGGLAAWLDRFQKKRKLSSEDDAKAALPGALAQLRAPGVAFVGDVSNALLSVEPLREAGLEGVVFYEVHERLDARDAEAIFKRAAARIENLDSSKGLRVVLSPHAPYTVSRRLFELLRGWSEEHGAPLGVHLAEGEDENLLYESGAGELRAWFERLGVWPWPPGFSPTGKTTTATLDAWGLVHERTLAVHGAALRRADVEILAKRGAALCLCPRSNLYIGEKIPPVEVFLEAGLPMALGTDSLASNDDLSLFKEMRLLGERFPSIPHREILKMATLNGARALGVPEERVSFAAGNRPAVMKIGCRVPIQDAEAHLVLRGHEHAAERVA
jgi:cytosine/adenosine deaminase-related metal-dependent hydrolase